jgi:hypothetical protein
VDPTVNAIESIKSEVVSDAPLTSTKATLATAFASRYAKASALALYCSIK